MIERLLAQREIAIRNGDIGLVREIDAALVRYGHIETATRALEQATPERKPRGRPRKNPA